MEIEYKGANALIIKSGALSVIVDPRLSLVGLKDLKVTGQIELVTDNNFAVEGDQKILINGPGEYEVSGVSIKGIPAKRHIDETDQKVSIYQLEIAGQKIAILGHISGLLDESQLESIGVIDILTIPIGDNGYTLDAHEAAKIVGQIDPRIVIPTHYADKGLKYEVPQNDLADFLKELGAQQHEVVDKLKIKKGVLPVVLTVYEVKRS